MYLRNRFKERCVCQMTERSLAPRVASSGHGQASDSVPVRTIQVRQLGGSGYAASGRSAISNSLLAPAPAVQPSRSTPRLQVNCLVSANPNHNAFRGGAAGAIHACRPLPGFPNVFRSLGTAVLKRWNAARRQDVGLWYVL